MQDYLKVNKELMARIDFIWPLPEDGGTCHDAGIRNKAAKMLLSAGDLVEAPFTGRVARADLDLFGKCAYTLGVAHA
jgi:hypothetical protein